MSKAEITHRMSLHRQYPCALLFSYFCFRKNLFSLYFVCFVLSFVCPRQCPLVAATNDEDRMSVRVRLFVLPIFKILWRQQCARQVRTLVGSQNLYQDAILTSASVSFIPGFYQSIELRSGASKDKSTESSKMQTSQIPLEKSGRGVQSTDFTYPQNISLFSSFPFLVPNFCSCVSSYPYSTLPVLTISELPIHSPYTHVAERRRKLGGKYGEEEPAV